MKTVKTTLVSTVVAAAFGLALGLMGTPAQAHCPHKDSTDHFHCDGGGALSYFATLTGGGFEFPEMEVIANSKKNLLTRLPDAPQLELTRPAQVGSDQFLTWNEVFNDCPNLLVGSAVEDFSVDNSQFRIFFDATDVNVIFVDIRFEDNDPALLDKFFPAEVTVILRSDELGVPFLPGAGETRTHILNKGITRGSTLKGIHPRSGCGGSGTDPLISPSVLVIRAELVP